MPRYESNPAAVRSSLEIFPTDDYNFIIGEPKSFQGETKNGKNKGNINYGVRISLTVADGDFKGKRYIKTLYEHNEGSQSVGKQFKMAALGYGKGQEEEARFDADWGGKDWSFDTDTASVGDAWREMSGKRVTGSLEKEIATDGSGTESQKEKGWRPYGA